VSTLRVGFRVPFVWCHQFPGAKGSGWPHPLRSPVYCGHRTRRCGRRGVCVIRRMEDQYTPGAYMECRREKDGSTPEFQALYPWVARGDPYGCHTPRAGRTTAGCATKGVARGEPPNNVPAAVAHKAIRNEPEHDSGGVTSPCRCISVGFSNIILAKTHTEPAAVPSLGSFPCGAFFHYHTSYKPNHFMFFKGKGTRPNSPQYFIRIVVGIYPCYLIYCKSIVRKRNSSQERVSV
jgi:hypothetical protein